MTCQIAVRLPDDLVEFVDRVVREGGGKSRAGVVTQALERERRRRLAERDIELLTVDANDDDWQELAKHNATTSMADLD